MNSQFINRSNYLVAFLAAIIGLSAFKDTLSSWTITIFSHSYTWLSLSVPLILAILIAAYIGAFAHFSDNITFTKLPLSKYLGNLSNFFAVLGLFYPLVLGLLLIISFVFAQIKSNPDQVNTIYNISTTITSIVSIVAAAYAVKNFSFIRSDVERQAILESLEKAIRKNIETPKGKDKGYSLLYEYEFLQRLMIRYLQFRGFGINYRSSVLKLAHILQDKGVLTAEDVDIAGKLNKQRNAFAHGQASISGDELRTALSQLNDLQKKMKAAIIDNDIEAEK